MTTAGRAGRLMEPLRAGIAVVLVAAAVGLVGCTPGPAPKPTPTPLFTSEAEAFKAAEQVYRDYTDAGNAAHGGDSEAKPEQYLAGVALEDEISVQRQLEEQKLKVVGPIRIVSFEGTGFESATARVTAKVCLDVKDARVVDASGTDVTPRGRQEQGLLDLAFTRSGGGLVIIESKNSDAKCSAVAP
ncbi:hypothetical protein ACTJI8_08280 [Microbacterium sp. 22303]|uniref:hypothetical protein n=1 Tax=Microbacterium sp. 22303 TaxID=3453905 RepID=UPI003F8259DD